MRAHRHRRFAQLAALAVAPLLLSVAGASAQKASAGPPACIEALGKYAARVCAPSEAGGDWLALQNAGAPPAALSAATRPCAREATAPLASACAKIAIWRAGREAIRATRPGSLTGLYRPRANGVTGELTIVEDAAGRTRLRLMTRRAPSGHVCRIAADSAWIRGREIGWKGELSPGVAESVCAVSARPLSDTDVVVEGPMRCDWACGRHGDYRLSYRLDR